MVIQQYDIYLVKLNPTMGHEIKKTRPCVVLSPDILNEMAKTVILAPITSKSHPYPVRVAMTLNKRSAYVVLDQVLLVDQSRLVRKLGKLNMTTVRKVKAVLKEMLVD